MAPVKFGLFRARSRDQPEPPSTENLLQPGQSTEMVDYSNYICCHFSYQTLAVTRKKEITNRKECGTSNSNYLKNQVSLDTPGSPSTNHHLFDEVASLRLHGDEDEACSERSVRRNSLNQCSKQDESQINYKPLRNQKSVELTSTSTLHDDDEINNPDDLDSTLALELDQDGASTSCDANSIQFDESSIAPSEDMSVYCGGRTRPKKSRSKEEQQIRDFGMWQASNVEVLQNLLSRSGTLDDQIKWEAIANSRGLCTLTDSCTCGDCARTKYLAGVADGDGGLGAAPLFNAISVGCCLQ